MARERSKPFGWDAAHFVEWATVTEMLHRLGIQPGARAIDVGCGSGYEGRVRGFTWQPARRVVADLAWAPQAHLWPAAQRPRS